MRAMRAAGWAVGVMVLSMAAVYAEDYPNKPIRIITTGAGGDGDLLARQVAQGTTGPLGQPVVIDNRTALTAAKAVSKAALDGYTLISVGGGFLIYPSIQKAPYAVSDFTPISHIAREVMVVTVHPSLPVKSVKELIALAKAHPGELNYASNSLGSSSHMAVELLKSMARVNSVRVPYKADSQGIAALIGGEVQVMIVEASAAIPSIKSGKLRALAVTSAEPSALTPGLPTVAATGLSGHEATSLTGIYAPVKTPAAIINRLNQEIVRFLNQSTTKERLLSIGEEVVASTPEQFDATIKAEISRMSNVIKDANIKME